MSDYPQFMVLERKKKLKKIVNKTDNQTIPQEKRSLGYM